QAAELPASFGRQQHSTNSQWSHQSRPTQQPIGPTTIIVHAVVQSKRLSPAIIKLRNLDSPNRIKVPQEIMITPIHNPATLKEQQERQVGREIEITDLRNQRERAPRQSSTAAFGSDASVAGGSQRAVSHRRGKNPLLSLMIKAR
uniref:KID domain-containing protein n=1 Tax=Macrostomum lignano TaxID=282301 RepID=A0A1I8F3X9_9PLAT